MIARKAVSLVLITIASRAFARPTNSALVNRQDSACPLSDQPPAEGASIDDIFDSFALSPEPEDQTCLDACYGFISAYMNSPYLDSAGQAVADEAAADIYVSDCDAVVNFMPVTYGLDPSQCSLCLANEVSVANETTALTIAQTYNDFVWTCSSLYSETLADYLLTCRAPSPDLRKRQGRFGGVASAIRPGGAARPVSQSRPPPPASRPRPSAGSTPSLPAPLRPADSPKRELAKTLMEEGINKALQSCTLEWQVVESSTVPGQASCICVAKCLGSVGAVSPRQVSTDDCRTWSGLTAPSNKCR